MVINYSQDIRYSTAAVGTESSQNHSEGTGPMITHDKLILQALMLDDLSLVEKEHSKTYHASEVIAINEGQFFQGLKQFCANCLSDGKTVVVCGLDGDYRQEPFGEILDLIPISQELIRLNALCQECGDGTLAYFTKRKGSATKQVVIGGNELYLPVCGQHIS